MSVLVPEKPAEGIMKTGDYGDSKFYKIGCKCGNEDDDIHFEVEADEVGININVNTWTHPKTDWWNRVVEENHTPRFESSWLYSVDESIRSFINGFAHRIKISYALWTSGYLKYSQTTIMSEQQALNYAHTLINAIEDVKTFRKERMQAKDISEGC